MSENNVVALPDAPRPQLTAGHRPQAIVPTDMDSAYRLAKAVCLAGMAPKGLETPEKAMVAILHGLEIGLTPMAALQRIAVVNGRPTLWGDGAMGLVRASGLCEWVKERIEGEGDARVAVCEAKRRGEPEPIRRTFSIADAKRAGLWNKAGPWQQYSERMLQMRARAFALRDLFADVLGGLYLREEIEDDHERAELHPAPARPTPPVPPNPPASPAIEHQPAVTVETVAQPEPVAAKPPVPPRPPVAEAAARAVETVQKHFPGAEHVATREIQSEFIDWESTVKEFEDAAAVCRDLPTLDEAWNELVAVHTGRMPKPDMDRCESLYQKRLQALNP